MTAAPLCQTCKGLGVINPHYSHHLHPTAIFGTPCPKECDPNIRKMFAQRAPRVEEQMACILRDAMRWSDDDAETI